MGDLGLKPSAMEETEEGGDFDPSEITDRMDKIEHDLSDMRTILT
jgi:hypothetical protein